MKVMLELLDLLSSCSIYLYFFYLRVTHNIKAKRGEIEIPKLTDWDLVYVTGEIQYLRYPNGKSFVSIPHVSAKKVIRMENENECDDLEHLEKGTKLIEILLN